jgi:hypothetical protein
VGVSKKRIDRKAMKTPAPNERFNFIELEGQSVELRKKFDVHYCFGLDEVKLILDHKKLSLNNL